MKDPLSDTSPEADAVQVSLLRAAGASRRAAMALAMSRMVCALSRLAIHAASPGLSYDELAASLGLSALLERAFSEARSSP